MKVIALQQTFDEPPIILAASEEFGKICSKLSFELFNTNVNDVR